MGNRSKSHYGLETICVRGHAPREVVIFSDFHVSFPRDGMFCSHPGSKIKEGLDAEVVNSKGQVQYFVPLPRS